jgi:phosphoglycerate dehydrogenase-like enzyme
MNNTLPKAAIVLETCNEIRIYPPAIRRELDAICQVVVDNCPKEDLARRAAELAEVRFLFTGWGPPRLDAATLAHFPKLEAVFYGAGTIKDVVCDDFWAAGLPICSAWAANAVPVAEFTFAQIILALKQVHRFKAFLQTARNSERPPHFASGGTFGTTVGLISLGQIGGRVASLLRQLDVHVLAYDPYCSPAAAQKLGLELVGSLAELFARSRVVSLHAPIKPETIGMITGELIAALPPGGALINTARGILVREAELIAVMRERPDLTAILDVVHPEPAPADSPLYDLPNVFLTPHIAGSEGGECARMGRYMVDECRRFLGGEPLQWQVTREAYARMA